MYKDLNLYDKSVYLESVRYGNRYYNDYAQGIQGQHKTMAKRETVTKYK